MIVYALNLSGFLICSTWKWVLATWNYIVPRPLGAPQNTSGANHILAYAMDRSSVPASCPNGAHQTVHTSIAWWGFSLGNLVPSTPPQKYYFCLHLISVSGCPAYSSGAWAIPITSPLFTGIHFSNTFIKHFLFTHLAFISPQLTFIEHLLVPGMVLGAGDTAVNKTDQSPSPLGQTF